MPRSVKRKPPSVPARIPGLDTIEVKPESVQKALAERIDQVIHQESDQVRRRMLEETPDSVEALIDMAKGLKLMNTEGRIYQVPPYWPALKFLLEWQKNLLGQDQKTTVQVHDIPEDTKNLLREWMKQGQEPPPVVAREGIVYLEDN